MKATLTLWIMVDSSQYQPINSVTNGLVQIVRSQCLYPGLSASWVNPDNTTETVKLIVMHDICSVCTHVRVIWPV